MTTFYAWVVPAYFTGSPVDHTWVTSYDNRAHPYADIAAVKKAGQSNWYCWGDFHASGGASGHPDGFVGSRNGAGPVATCLVQPNRSCDDSPAARGTIFKYGLDGVCHQLANQVLSATGTKGKAPLTVKGVRGYAVSTFLYGTYGLQQAAWQSKLENCAGIKPLRRMPPTAEERMEEFPDDFEENARAALSDKPELLARLMALRSDVTAYAARRIPGFYPPDAAFLNARNQHLLDQAAALLGPEDFYKVFGVEPGERVDVVDPTIMGSERD